MSLGSYGARRSGSPLAGLGLLLAAGLVIGLGLALFLGLPRLTEAWPPDGARAVSSRASLRLTFSLPMDQAATEAAVSISPDLPGNFRWDAHSLIFTPAFPWPAGAQVEVALDGARSARGLPLIGPQLLGAHRWSFSVGEPRLAYLAGIPPNLWVIGLEPDAVAQPLSSEPLGVYDYAVSPDGSLIIYSARREDGGADLRLLRLDGAEPAVSDWLACPEQACVSPAFSPDTAGGAGRVAYQRHRLVPGLTGEMSFGPSHVFVRGLADHVDQIASQSEARFPRWAPDGRLTYFDLNRSAIVVHELATGAVTYVPTSAGEMPTWTPDGQSLILPDVLFAPAPTPGPDDTDAAFTESFYLNLMRVAVATNVAENISGSDRTDDASAAMAPSGTWLAFGRKQFAGGQWTPGRQLWLMRPNGSEARALTDDPLYNHSAFRWSPDSASIAYMRFRLADPGQAAEIWIVNLQAAGPSGAGEHRRIAAGYLPEWLP
jgi:TolB protein